jgi:hypothetical protein
MYTTYRELVVWVVRSQTCGLVDTQAGARLVQDVSALQGGRRAQQSKLAECQLEASLRFFKDGYPMQ